MRKGDQVRLTWTAPRETTDRATVLHLGVTRICRSLATTMGECGEPVSEVMPGFWQPGQAASYNSALPPELQQQNPMGTATYSIEVLNESGRSAGLSNAARVPLAPTLPAPANLKAEVTAGGIALSFTAPATPPAMARGEITYSVRIYRRAAGVTTDAVAGELPLPTSQPTFLDKGFEWEKSYQYRATTVTKVTPPGGPPAEVEGDDSPAVEVLAHDSFPPAAPTAVQAVASSSGGQSFIDLTWSLNNEADLAGYNVYRREAGVQTVKINTDLVKTPAFRDSNVTAGHTYLYTVTAVDLRANESGRSEETSETVPQP